MALEEGISEEQLKEMMDAFKLFDMNGDGHISKAELGKVLQALGQDPSQKEVDEIMAKADKNGSSFLEYDEYVELLKGHLKDPAIVEIELREAFRIFDKDRNNSLNVQELVKALCFLGEPLTQKEAKEMCDLMDVNKDKKVDVDEFVKFLCKRI
ncbi:calmodulin, striated muscle-like [Mya arenaria]|uniref:calmodulin, striated muscle-like n=1 Tax=Mya arenaria TaxID=6604 RepID=UPI0022E6A465|nr:calmodulin, striated muscle-like [Mya arenaria]